MVDGRIYSLRVKDLNGVLPSPRSVTEKQSIEVGESDGYVWLRVGGKGSFAKSPQLKAYAEKELRDGRTRFVVDLEKCAMMDSTFMGTLAGLAMKLAKTTGGCLQVAGASERNRQSLEDLGLDALMEVDPRDAEWQGHLEKIRSDLAPLEESGEESDALHVLQAHRQLCDANGNNLSKFATVLDVLEQQTGE